MMNKQVVKNILKESSDSPQIVIQNPQNVIIQSPDAKNSSDAFYEDEPVEITQTQPEIDTPEENIDQVEDPDNTQPPSDIINPDVNYYEDEIENQENIPQTDQTMEEPIESQEMSQPSDMQDPNVQPENIDQTVGPNQQVQDPSQNYFYEDEPQPQQEDPNNIQSPEYYTPDNSAQPQIDPNTGQAIIPQNEPFYDDELNQQPVQDPNAMPQDQVDPNMMQQGQPGELSNDPSMMGDPSMTPQSTDPMATGMPPVPGATSNSMTKTPDELDKISELKKIHENLITIRKTLEDETSPVYKKLYEKVLDSISYFNTIVANLDSYEAQINTIIIKYKRFIFILLYEINKLKQLEKI